MQSQVHILIQQIFIEWHCLGTWEALWNKADGDPFLCEADMFMWAREDNQK